jgi:hypothetical protein
LRGTLKREKPTSAWKTVGNEKSSPNLVLSAEGESKQTISVRISNETLRQIHELLIEEKRFAKEKLLMEPSMTWIVEELLRAGFPVFKSQRKDRNT